ncbi:hypothetical protein BDD12DRAFT_875035 [Trichophaea hybrida]|nr:hypothetical protein BDD12DRAFT_875035 [Trichophaea hybrida]
MAKKEGREIDKAVNGHRRQGQNNGIDMEAADDQWLMARHGHSMPITRMGLGMKGETKGE